MGKVKHEMASETRRPAKAAVTSGSNYYPDGRHAPVRSEAPCQENEKGELEWHRNPFWSGFSLRTRAKRQVIHEGGLKVVEKKTGITADTAEITRTFEVDPEVFVKVFARHLRVFFDLSPASMKVFHVVMHEMSREYNNDYVYLNADTCIDYLKRQGVRFSKSSYYRAREEMIEKGIIAPSTRMHIYWINPALVFNGSRVKFVTELSEGPEVIPPSREEKPADESLPPSVTNAMRIVEGT